MGEDSVTTPLVLLRLFPLHFSLPHSHSPLLFVAVWFSFQTPTHTTAHTHTYTHSLTHSQKHMQILLQISLCTCVCVSVSFPVRACQYVYCLQSGLECESMAHFQVTHSGLPSHPSSFLHDLSPYSGFTPHPPVLRSVRRGCKSQTSFSQMCFQSYLVLSKPHVHVNLCQVSVQNLSDQIDLFYDHSWKEGGHSRAVNL